MRGWELSGIGKERNGFMSDHTTHFELSAFPGALFRWFGRLRGKPLQRLRRFVHARDKGQCRDCGLKVSFRKFHCHHVLEVSQGGTNHPTNLVTLCRACHEKKHPHLRNPNERISLRSGENERNDHENGKT